jgi:uncharacterized protein (TIGR00661 family)
LVPDDGQFLLGYMVNHGYAEQIQDWHQQNPEWVVHVFWDKPGAPNCEEVRPNLFFHTLHERKFLTMMAECSGYITTAGFESLCEALYLGKPTLMVPVAGHYEQACNALDAVKAGVGISASGFEVDRLVQFLPFYQPKDQAFRQWADSAGHQLLALFENSQVPLLPPSASEWAASWRPAWE